MSETTYKASKPLRKIETHHEQERHPVKRAQAEVYVLITLISFAASVIITRVYLEMTGYPQLGSGNLHIAHVLWGGLLLYIAGLLPLVLLNRSALTWSAILNGVGVGLFIDEVGKFITRDVDYFYPPAAPIIYAFFLLSLLFYFFVRRPARRNPRAELYRAIEELPVLVDGLLLERDRQEVQDRLEFVGQSSNPRYSTLANKIINYLQDEHLALAVGAPGIVQKLRRSVIKWGHKLGQKQHRRIILWLVGLNGLKTVFAIVILILIAFSPSLFNQPVGQQLVSDNELRSIDDLPWFLVRFGLQLITGLMTLAGFVQLWRGREVNGINIVIFSLILSLTTIVLLNFYLDQFRAISNALLEFFLLLFFVAYRQWYLAPADSITNKNIKSKDK